MSFIEFCSLRYSAFEKRFFTNLENEGDGHSEWLLEDSDRDDCADDVPGDKDGSAFATHFR